MLSGACLLTTLTPLPQSKAAGTPAPSQVATKIPSFPGAEGAGARATGGRGGTVYEVTNLNDAGAGSLRDAVSEGNRIVIFRVSGTIELKSRLTIAKPNITIAGQTAPGDGICLRDCDLYISTNNVIVRYLRVRLGDASRRQSDSITVWRGSSNVILDHCSATWSVDESLSLGGDVGDVTVQWCLIGEALRQSVHVKGRHCFGSLMRASGKVSLHHNLWVHNDSRNPRLGDTYGKMPSPTFDVRNNVMYDYGGTCSGSTQGVFNANYVGNYIKAGPSSTAKTPISVGGPSSMYFYINSNVWEGHDDYTADNNKFFNQTTFDGREQVHIVPNAFVIPPVKTTSAKDAYTAVLASVGASLPTRDAVDSRIIGQVKEVKGQMINSQNDVGGWPELKSTPAPLDTDHDGMPDSWERKHHLNPKKADGALDSDKDGYTNIEEYLNKTNPNQFVDYNDARNNRSSLW